MKRIEKALEGLTPEIMKHCVKEARMDLRVTESEKEEIRLTAESLGLNATEYLLFLHRYAAARLRNS